MGPYFSYSRIMRREWEAGKPKRITGVGSVRFEGEIVVVVKRDSGWGEGAIVRMGGWVGTCWRIILSLFGLSWEGGGGSTRVVYRC